LYVLSPFVVEARMAPQTNCQPRDLNKKSNYAPRRLINAEKRRQRELEMTAKAEVRENTLAGDEQAKGGWVKATKHLIDDFRLYE
jgi:general transcription factor 3C polypeptide 3 (transcription factor C subunit 4)